MTPTPISPSSPPRGSWLQRNAIKLVAVGFWLAIVIGVVIYQQQSGLSAQALAADLAERLSGAIAGTWYGPFIYVLIYFLRPVILFPASILTILAGNLYGLWLGLVWGLLGGTVSAVIPFFAGRWLFAQQGTPPAPATSGNPLGRFTGILRENPFQAVLTMRLLFLPYDAASIFAGSLGVPFGQFFLATLLGNVVGAIPYIALGASIEGNPFSAEASINPWILGFAALMLVASIVFSRLMKRRVS